MSTRVRTTHEETKQATGKRVVVMAARATQLRADKEETRRFDHATWRADNEKRNGGRAKRTIAEISNDKPTTILCVVLGDFPQCVFLLLGCCRHGNWNEKGNVECSACSDDVCAAVSQYEFEGIPDSSCD